MSTPRPPIRALLIDISGTLHVGSQPVPGAVHALSLLRYNRLPDGSRISSSKPVPFRFCSNTSKESRNELEARLRGMSFELRSDTRNSAAGDGREMWTSLGAVSGLLQKRGLRNPFCLLEPSPKDEIFRDLGPSSEGTWASDSEYDSVVVGLAPSLLTYEHLNTAFRILLSSKPKPLIATHSAKYIRVAEPDPSKSEASHETLSLGPGPFVAALETATGARAEVVGKPSRAFFEMVIASFGEDEVCSDGKITIIGDDIETDLGGGAVELGLWRVLVRTGKYRAGDENRSGVVPPDEVHDSFAAFVESLLGGS
ncbi:uncharacterized protein PHACADRAFT_87446 [Phanerochaete carnosa HHB-10118-sp]|uniref:Uncharacterized protein n=1 Tax=Phanerochaete carnosa (strain HHB-10118-sp) TaxID=650164 RepID=K5X7B2_PHACS|nr:uncharacterized protein PHACADRAFT_87446 [Phanerochaete carnosa HHB-10118-sp]EKM58762.1 hypothetical protein PHACADRAFT_87446 [Phanerochaete carnosa HHB-10118-sp]